MAILEMKQLSFSYPDETLALKNISFQIKAGECIVICGASGSGKSTLLQLLKREIQPVGTIQGDILYDGIPLHMQDVSRSAQEIGMIFQDPENQMVMDEVWQELAFGLENMGYFTNVIRKRVAEIVNFFGIEELLSRKTFELSGGQKQVINLAAVLLMQPKVLLLDEPTAQLDPVAAKDFLQMIQRLNEELGMTIVMVEHRLEDVFALADRVFVMEDGQIKYSGSSKDVIKQIWEMNDKRFLSYLPAISKLYLATKKEHKYSHQTVPVSVKEGRHWIQSLNHTESGLNISSHTSTRQYSKDCSSTLLQIKNVQFQYQRDGKPVLKHMNLSLKKEEWIAVVGGNGAGKTTLLQIAAGLLVPQIGSVLVKEKNIKRIREHERYQIIGYLAQNPKLYFVHDTVQQELLHVLHRLKHLDLDKDLDRLIHKLGIESILEKHPYDCSGGEQQKVALAGVLLTKPQILLIDEPTKGLDPLSKEDFAQILEELRQEGISILMVTHDIEFAARYATRCAMLFDGQITSEGIPQEFFQGNFFYTTTINRVFRDCMPSAITYEEVLAQWRDPVF